MHLSQPELPGEAQPEPFPPDWLTNDPIRTIINSAPAGIALMKATRNEAGQITDFCYQMANPMLGALTKHPEEDLLSQSLTNLTPDVVETGMLSRLIQVVNTGHPGQYVEVYRMDGVIGHYDQVYIKSDDGVLMLVQDVTYSPLSAGEKRQQAALLTAILGGGPIRGIRSMLVALISGQAG